MHCLNPFRSPVYQYLEELIPATELMHIPFRWPNKLEMLNSPLSPKYVNEPELFSPPEALAGPSTSTQRIVPAFEAEHKFLPTIEPMQSIVRACKPPPLNIDVNVEPTIDDIIRFYYFHLVYGFVVSGCGEIVYIMVRNLNVKVQIPHFKPKLHTLSKCTPFLFCCFYCTSLTFAQL
jgi:hypothetical protein